MKKKETYRNEIKSYIVRSGMTMSEVVEVLVIALARITLVTA